MATPSSNTCAPFDAALTQVEQALAVVTERLVQGEANELQRACESLQHALLACSRIEARSLQSLSMDVKLSARLQSVRAGVAQVREHVARRAAAVQRSLQTLLPSHSAPTYGRGAAAFGRGSRPAASFTSLSA